MDKKKRGIPAEAQAQNDRIFAEVQAQMANDQRENTEYLTRAEHQIKENESMAKTLKVLAKRNNDMWAQCGIDINSNDGQNPVLVLEKIAPDAFKGMSEWTEKSRRAAIEEIESLGFDYAAIKRSASEKRSELSAILTSATSDKSDNAPEQQAKKFVRRVRL
ncbi:MAG: hypothetical protein LBD33_01365 [Puniceicoccales bacterium]|nr:hypothetical protein [Puniceicoccales bacterium]